MGSRALKNQKVTTRLQDRSITPFRVQRPEVGGCEAMVPEAGTSSRKNPIMVPCKYKAQDGRRFCSRHPSKSSIAGATTVLVLVLLVLISSCGRQLPVDGDRCTRAQASHTFCDDSGTQIVCETTGRLPPDDALWFSNGPCQGWEGPFCQSMPWKSDCEAP